MSDSKKINELLAKIEKLEQENAMLKRDFSAVAKGNTVNVPEGIKPLFDEAQKIVGDYFRNLKMDPTQSS